MDDLVTWANTTAALLTTDLPLQSLNSAVNLAFAYISNVGGWVPNDPSDPNGPGAPANSATETEAAATIAAQQYAEVYDLNFQVLVTVECQMTAQLGFGLDLAAAAAALSPDVAAFITTAINGSSIPVRVNSVSTQTPTSGKSLIGGQTTETIRQIIASDLIGDNKIIDYKELALQYATTVNGLDDTWNVQSVYSQNNTPVVVTIVKYADNTYNTLDTTSTTIYVYSVSPTTYQIVTGVILNSM
jgi:hypothetical protein